jgi:hypothetical protein
MPLIDTQQAELITRMTIFRAKVIAMQLEHQEVVGLPAMAENKFYMVPFDPTTEDLALDPVEATQQSLLQVNWHLQFS